MKDEKKYSRLGTNVLWMFVGNFSSKILLFFLVPFYTSILTTSEYGISDLITTTISLITPFLILLVDEGILRFTLNREIDKKQIFTLSITIIFLGFLILLIATPVVWINPILKNYYGLFLLYYLFSVLSNVMQQFLKGLDHVKTFVISGIICTISNITLNVVFLLIMRLGIKGYLFAFIGSYAITSIYICLKERVWQYLISLKQLDIDLAKSFLLYCLPLIPNSISWWVSNSSDKYILTVFWGTAITGVYSIAYKIPSLMSTISNIFTSAWQISAVENFGNGESEKFFSEIYIKYSSFYILIVSGIILFIKVIARIMFSKDFFIAWHYATILIIASMFQALCSFLGSIYTTAMKTRMIFITTMMGAILNIFLNFILIPNYSATGAALATLASYFAVWLIRLVNSRRILKLNIELKKDIICYLIISLQCTLMNLEVHGVYILDFLLLIILLFLNRRIIVEMLNIINVKIIKCNK